MCNGRQFNNKAFFLNQTLKKTGTQGIRFLTQGLV